MDYSLQTDVEKPQLVAPPDAMLVLTGGSEVEETQRVEETPASSWHRSMVVIEKYFSRLSENSDIEDDASRAEPGDDHLIDVDPGGMNCGNKAVPAISGRVIAAAAGLTVLGIPLAIGIGVEDCAQLGPRQLRPQRRSILRSIAWNGASAMYEDIVNLARDRAPYAGVRWAWPTASLHERKVVALTFDDAPGDNPAAMHSLLDTLKRYGARATFFCTTDMITSAMEAVMDRIVGEGHELGNHMPKDRVYSLFREAGFERELCHAEETIHRVEQKTAATDAYRTRYDSQTWRRRFKWFRPPFGLMSEAMARVLKRKRYLLLQTRTGPATIADMEKTV
eukprot:CAMPEP_0185790992 /NCGR_PEP_ID=MMETSP1174-20130828/158113_1 /TAXON_ID=35687 /ORGANISM="Dictyocha speculum, Strain CCMP1381" /LENGTH=335 /DNA_ID=CAMNT_0028485867 /DNA_START=129 /DNA_END=1137 /DNA_ORIENTATION=-